MEILLDGTLTDDIDAINNQYYNLIVFTAPGQCMEDPFFGADMYRYLSSKDTTLLGIETHLRECFASAGYQLVKASYTDGKLDLMIHA